ncbi:hypothetical protein AMATHDRAFT_106355, partial [Amanita thiersii Skay4041]
ICGILCTQWLREYTREISLPAEHAIPIRQMHYDGLISWKVPKIVSALPVILQISVLLFFVGILDLLASLHPIVAALVAAVIGLTVGILAFTTVLSVLQILYEITGTKSATLHQCPFKSPQSMSF